MARPDRWMFSRGPGNRRRTRRRKIRFSVSDQDGVKMTGSSFVLSFGDPQCRTVSLSGGKGGSMATMMQEGLPVPPGFVVTSAAFTAAVDQERLRTCCRARDMTGAREIVAAARPPATIVAEHYAVLNGLVAVRSSACAEDSEGASYAGQQETYLNVDGLPA